MDINKKEYKIVANVIGWSLCIFLAMINGISIIGVIFSELLFKYLPYDVYNIIDTVLFDIIGYMASFIVPAIIIRSYLKKKGLCQPINHESGRFTATSLLLIPVGVMLTQFFGTVNAMVMDIFGTTEVYYELIGADSYQFYWGYEIILLFVSMAIVPAVAEEFLFRATVLSNLKPYGKVMAVVGSSFLFALMHQNPYQLIYTMVAGLVMGYAYVKTGSIWCPMLIHFFNNALSVVQQVLLGNTAADVAYAIIGLLNVSLNVAGVICLVLYIKRMIREKRTKYKNGSFGVLLEESRDYSTKPVEKGRIRGFFSAGMVVFIVISAILIFSLFVRLVSMSAGGGAV